MKISHLLEDKKLPGAVKGISVMSPEEFVKKDVEDSDVNESMFGNAINSLKTMVLRALGKNTIKTNNDAQAFQQMMKGITGPVDSSQYGKLWQEYKNSKDFYVTTPTSSDLQNKEKMFLWANSIAQFVMHKFPNASVDALSKAVLGLTDYATQEYKANNKDIDEAYQYKFNETDDNELNLPNQLNKIKVDDYLTLSDKIHDRMVLANQRNDKVTYEKLKQKYLELEKLAKKGMIPEATKLPASSREFGGDEFQDYMKRIIGTPDIDKKTGQVKLDKKGKEKYVSGKTKQDKYKMPYIHRSSVVKYYDESGKRFREEQVIEALKQRPKKLLKQNEKMKHSNGELEQFFNVGFAALVGVAVDETTDKLIIVNTCPGAGSCKVDCFAMKGGKIQFEAAWQSDGRILTYLLNDPNGFFDQLSSEIAKEEKLGDKGGYEVTIRWHDAGDFFSTEYLDMALKMAEKHPGVKFYAYTKMSDAVLADKPGNFIINWSEGAHTSQEKKVKSSDPNLDTTKNSRIVPTDAFDDLLVKDSKGNLVKGPDGQWQIQSEKLPELKSRLAKLYNISSNSILSYDEYINRPKIKGLKYNVIVAPGEGDISANDPDVISTLLLRH